MDGTVLCDFQNFEVIKDIKDLVTDGHYRITKKTVRKLPCGQRDCTIRMVPRVSYANILHVIMYIWALCFVLYYFPKVLFSMIFI